MTKSFTEAAADEIFEAPETPPELAARAKRAGWPDELLERALRLRVGQFQIDEWLTTGFPAPSDLEGWLESRERLMYGTLRVRQARWDDGEKVADLFAHAPETVGGWELTVDRSPDPFAQYRLQEHAFLQLLEDRGVVLGAFASAGRNSLVAGKEVSVGLISSWRIRTGFRGRGYSKLVQNTAGPSNAWFPVVNYWYVRPDNAGALSWNAALKEKWEARPAEFAQEVSGLSATVFHTESEGRTDSRVRTTERADLERCCALVNRTHAGLDLFRAYTPDFLRERLDDMFWGPKPPFWTRVYEWGDHFVLEDGGEAVACAGLWDQGRHMRERWRNPDTGEEHVVDHAALMDFGCAEGREDALADLIGHLAVRRAELGRTTLVAPLEFLPAVRERLGWAELRPESRSFMSMPFAMPGLEFDGKIERPYTDLAYW